MWRCADRPDARLARTGQLQISDYREGTRLTAHHHGVIVPSPTTTDAPPTLMPVTSPPLMAARTCRRLGRRTSAPCRNTIDAARSGGTRPFFAMNAPAGPAADPVAGSSMPPV